MSCIGLKKKNSNSDTNINICGLLQIYLINLFDHGDLIYNNGGKTWVPRYLPILVFAVKFTGKKV